MDNERTKFLKEFYLSPYIQLATALIGKSREAGGNMFRHQMDTMAILIDYGYIDSVLLKASVIHDLIEDLPDFNRNHLLTVDYESPQVYELVMEVSRTPGETKPAFLTRILEKGSHRAQLLKTADRISNMISLGFVNKEEFVRRYTEETVRYVLPIAHNADKQMLRELTGLVESRREYLGFLKSLNITMNEAANNTLYSNTSKNDTLKPNTSDQDTSKQDRFAKDTAGGDSLEGGDEAG